ncbi:MAG: hypothetical protein AAFV53_20920 [Myxococcota bacterium]
MWSTLPLVCAMFIGVSAATPNEDVPDDIPDDIPDDDIPNPHVEDAGAAALAAANAVAIRRMPRATSLELLALRMKAPSSQKAEIDYYIGRCLERIGLLHAAHRLYLVAARRDSPWRPDVLDALVRSAVLVGDDEPLIALAVELPVRDFPDVTRGDWLFLRAQGMRRQGDLDAARDLLEQVDTASVRHPAAQLQRAILEERPEAARDRILRLLSLKVRGSRLARVDLRLVQDLARLNLGRLYYAAHQYEAAAAIYDSVPDGARTDRARLEAAWALAVAGKTDAALERLVRNPLPEAALLQAVLQKDDDRSDAIAQQWRQQLDAMQDLVDRYTVFPAGLWTLWFEGADASEETPMPPSFFIEALRDVRLSGAIYRMDQINRERALLARQPDEWAEWFRPGLEKALEDDFQALRVRAGAVLLEKIADQQRRMIQLRSELAHPPEAQAP